MIEENKKEMVEDKRELKEIDIDNLYISESNVRKLNVEKETDSLAGEMRRSGLHQPIEARWDPDKNMFEVINGQRRTIAAKKLGWTKIRAFVLSDSIPKREDIIRSLAENVHRLDIDPRDRANAIRQILDMYDGDWNILSDVLNRSVVDLKKWEEYGSVIEPLKDMVTQGKLNQGSARELTKISKTDDSNIVKIATQISGIERRDPDLRKRIFEYIKRKPEAKSEEIYEKFFMTDKKEEELPLSISVVFTPRIAKAIKTSSEKRNETPNQFITSITRDWLETKGLLND